MNNERQLNLFDDNKPAMNPPADAIPDQKLNPPNIELSWLKELHEEFHKPYMKNLKQFLIEEKQKFTVYPKGKDIFNAFWFSPFDQVRVVILGQDPYHGKNQAHGLCFSVNKGIPMPPSLGNIFKELNADLNIPIPKHGCLSFWAKQGVFLLNTSLTVRANQANSHAGKGWEIFTDKVISILNEKKENLIFILWGRNAKNKMQLIDSKKHLILSAAHPSPFSAHNGFFGCKHFSRTNEYLVKMNQSPIDWRLAGIMHHL